MVTTQGSLDRNSYLAGVWFKLMNIRGLGNKGLRSIAEACRDHTLSGDLTEDWPLLKTGPLAERKEDIRNAYLDTELENQWQRLLHRGVGLLYPGHPLLSDLYRAPKADQMSSSLPTFLFYWGMMPEILRDSIIGVVGSRVVDPYILQQTHLLVQRLSAARATILSGYARGVDTAAHAAALNNEAPTTAVLPHGISGIFDQQSETPILKTRLSSLLKNMNWTRNLLFLSQFYPRTRWKTQYYILRNITICALSKKLVVMASEHEQSGSYQTAMIAQRLGVSLYVFVPKRRSAQSAGNLSLCKQKNVTALNESDIETFTP